MKVGTTNSFTSKYSAYYLLFYEGYQDINTAIARKNKLQVALDKRNQN